MKALRRFTLWAIEKLLADGAGESGRGGKDDILGEPARSPTSCVTMMILMPALWATISTRSMKRVEVRSRLAVGLVEE